jgi:hypothetical protein
VRQADELAQLESQHGFQTIRMPIRRADDAKKLVFAGKADAVLLTVSAAVNESIDILVKNAHAAKAPTISQLGGTAEHGVVLTLNPSAIEQGEAAARLVARLLRGEAADEDFAPLFDRRAEFGALLAEIGALRPPRGVKALQVALRHARRLRKAFDQLVAIDFFAGEAQRQTAAALQALEAAVASAQSPDEPRVVAGAAVPRLDRADYQARVWATRRRPWVDRLASAWLIRRCIDPAARFVWLKSPADCPKRAVGFDFDGAAFTHVGARVTFETLLAAFDLETPALRRLGVLVHGMDAGGVQPPEAAGIERVLAGMLEAIADDDHLLQAAAGVFEGLLVAFEKDSA